MHEIIDQLDRVANELESAGMASLALRLDMVANSLDKSAASAPRAEFVFPGDHPKVTDGQDHFPINTLGRGRNALARANGFDRSPPWYDGSLADLKRAVAAAVRKRWPPIEVSEAATD